MAMSTPLSHSDQIDRIRRLIRRLRTKQRKAWEEADSLYRKRRRCPAEMALLVRQSQQVQDNIMLAEACLKELLRQEALALSPWKAGDCVIVSYVDYSGPRDKMPYLILEVEAGVKRGAYSYRVLAITKEGRTTRRNWTYICPSRYVQISRAEVRLSDEGRREVEYWREIERSFTDRVFNKGDLSAFQPVTGYLGTAAHEAKYRLP